MEEQLYIYSIIVLSGIVTYAIRVSGFIGSKMLDESSPFFIYINYISYALVGALVMQLIITPQNALAEVSMWLRVGLSLVCVAVYVWRRSNLLLYILSTVTLLTLILSWW